VFIVSLVEFSKRVQNEISAKVMPKPQNFAADFADEGNRKVIEARVGCRGRKGERARERNETDAAPGERIVLKALAEANWQEIDL